MSKKTTTKLRDIVQHRATVTLSVGVDIEVRPINVMDIMTLLSEFGPQVSMSYAKLTAMAKTKSLNERVVVETLENLLAEAPGLLTALIALSNDDDTVEGREVAASLPLADQLAIFDTMFRETLHSEATVKKLLASLSETAMMTFGALKTLKAPTSKSSTGPSVGK